MVRIASGKAVASVYPGDPLGYGDGLLVKTHLLDPENWDRAVHLVRHPLDAIEAYYAWRHSHGVPVTWERHVHQALYGPRGWVAHTRCWSEAPIPVLRVLYEDLHRDAVGQVVRVLDWLGEPVVGAHVARAVERCRFETLRARFPALLRRGEAGKGRATFRPSERTLVEQECEPWGEWWHESAA
jgi:hypothetical protein